MAALETIVDMEICTTFSHKSLALSYFVFPRVQYGVKYEVLDCRMATGMCLTKKLHK